MKSDVCLLLFFIFSAVNSQTGQRCRTPAGETSTCVGLYSCSQLLAATQIKPLPEDVKTYLRQSVCGYDNRTPRVCCGTVPRNILPTSDPETPPVAGNSDPVSRPNPSSNSEDGRLPREGECGVDAADRIYGGNVTKIDEFPWMVLLGYKTSSGSIKYSCGGVLINRRYVLTAAHCVTGEINTAIGNIETARLGEWDKTTPIDCEEGNCAPAHQDVRVDRYFAHPVYRSDPRNKTGDIALVRLATRANLNDFVKPICLAPSQTTLRAGDEVQVAGWGATLNSSSSTKKLKVAIPLYDHDKCITKFRGIKVPVSSSQVCAGGVFAKDSCKGDSGGPLMKKRSDGVWESIAVVSFGLGCGSDGWPGVYSSVPAYRSWIEQMISEYN